MVVYIRHRSGFFYDFYYISKDPLKDGYDYVEYPYWDGDGWVAINPYRYLTYSEALTDALKNNFKVISEV